MKENTKSEILMVVTVGCDDMSLGSLRDVSVRDIWQEELSEIMCIVQYAATEETILTSRPVESELESEGILVGSESVKVYRLLTLTSI
jgi:hypothetical protein